MGRLVFDFTVLEVVDEHLASLGLITYVPAPGTGTRGSWRSCSTERCRCRYRSSQSEAHLYRMIRELTRRAFD